MDVITHVTDLLAFRAEAIALAGQTELVGMEERLIVPELSYDAETQELVYNVTKIPVLYTGSGTIESLTLIRAASDEQLSHFTHMTRLGVCVNGEYVFDSPEAQAEYDRVRGDLTFIVDGEEYTKPYKIGVFL